MIKRISWKGKVNLASRGWRRTVGKTRSERTALETSWRKYHLTLEVRGVVGSMGGSGLQ